MWHVIHVAFMWHTSIIRLIRHVPILTEQNFFNILNLNLLALVKNQSQSSLRVLILKGIM